MLNFPMLRAAVCALMLVVGAMPELIQSGALIGMKYSQKAMQSEQPKR